MSEQYFELVLSFRLEDAVRIIARRMGLTYQSWFRWREVRVLHGASMPEGNLGWILLSEPGSRDKFRMAAFDWSTHEEIDPPPDLLNNMKVFGNMIRSRLS